MKIKSTIIRLILIVSLLSIAIIGLYLFITATETTESRFPSFDIMAKSNVYSGGWIPRIIPQTARNIKERHNIDINNSLIRFEIDPIGDNFLSRCEKVTNTAEIQWPTGKSKWWPSELVNKANYNAGFVVYKCPCDNCYGYFSSSNGTIFYYWAN